MAAPRVMSGARAKLAFVDPATQQATVVGIFNNVSYSLTYDAQPVYILGRYSPADIEYTAQEAVPITASGFRVLQHGPHVDGKMPKLQDLISHEYLELTVIDRQSDTRIAKFRNVRPTGYSTTISARQLEEIQINMIGLLVDDESVENAETPSATQLP